MDARVRVSDYLWAAVAGLAFLGIARAMVAGVAGLVRHPTLGQVAIFTVGTVLILVVGHWIVLGAWRRTVWGAPPGGVREHRERDAAARAGR